MAALDKYTLHSIIILGCEIRNSAPGGGLVLFWKAAPGVGDFDVARGLSPRGVVLASSKFHAWG